MVGFLLPILPCDTAENHGHSQKRSSKIIPATNLLWPEDVPGALDNQICYCREWWPSLQIWELHVDRNEKGDVK